MFNIKEQPIWMIANGESVERTESSTNDTKRDSKSNIIAGAIVTAVVAGCAAAIKIRFRDS